MASNLENISRELQRHVGRVVSRLSLDIVARLIETTPVDTGWARANWIPSVGAPVTATDGSPEGVSSGRQSAGMAELATYRLSQGPAWIANNVPYIRRLNDGHSAQAPAGFVQIAIARAIGALR